MKIGLLTVLFNDKPLEEVAKYAAGSRLRGLRARRLARLEPLRHRPGDGEPAVRAGHQEDARGPRDHDLRRSRTTSRRRWCCRSATRRSTSGPARRTRRRWSGSAREHIIKTAEVASELEVAGRQRLLRLDRVGELVHLAAPAPRHLRAGLGALRRALDADPRPLQGARRQVRARGAPDRDRLQRLHRARGHQAAGGRDDWGFNFDPSHLVWQHDRPGRVHQGVRRPHLHVHAKDWELQKDIVHIDGVTGTGSWQRKDRAARYRVPGWGDVEWRRVITALLEVGYDYVHELRARGSGHERGGRLRAVHQVPQAAHHQEAARARPGVVAGVGAGPVGRRPRWRRSRRSAS